MIVEDFRHLVLSKAVNRHKLPDDEDFFTRIHTALKRVSRDTIALRLLVNDSSGQMIMRKIEEFAYIRFPEKPKGERDEIDIDESLMDAAALFLIAGLEKANAKTYMGMYYTEIEANDMIQIEATLSLGSTNTNNRNPSEVFA